MEAVLLSELENYDPHPLRQGARTRYLCPLSAACRAKPLDNAHRSLSVENTSGVFYCHRCGEKGKLREFWTEHKDAKPLVKKTHLRSVPARAVAALVSRAAAKDLKAEQKTSLKFLRERMRIVAAGFSGSPAEEYLSRRKIPAGISRAAGCGFADGWEHWEKQNGDWKLTGTDRRVVFPVCEAEGKLVALHTRAIDEKHIHSSKITRGNKSRGVFHSSPEVFASPVIAICEGPADALALQTCGVPAVAMIGTTAPDWLREKLKDRAVLLATDADKAGDDAAMKLKFSLQPFTKNIFRLRPLAAKDWAEELELAGAENLREYLSPFLPHNDDVARVNAAWQFAEQGFYDEAEFIARLVEDTELKKSFFSLIHREHLRAA
jgi:5S rRNA maturation endonuclease (ribonuclease M5)